MMYDHERSDPAMAGVKPTNKAGQPAAELAESRLGAEGIVSQQSTGRAQYRETVSQRIRQSARQRKKEKFTALLHHVSIDHLEEAFFELKKNAAPGVDGLTCRDYEAAPLGAISRTCMLASRIGTGVLEDGIVTVSDKGTG
jgi:RNA-directed DNA polymerase